MTNENTKKTLGSVEKTFHILEVLIDDPEPVGVSEISRRTKIKKSTVYKHLSTLSVLGYVEQTDEKAYRVSIRFLDYGQHLDIKRGVESQVHDLIDQLAETTNETAGLVVEQGGYAVDVYSSTSAEETEHPSVNTRHLHCSAPGKAILAEWAPERVEAFLMSKSFPALTDNTLTDQKELIVETERVRQRGFAFEREEQYRGINSVAVGITADDSTSAIYISGLSEEFSGKRFEENIPGVLLSQSQSISMSL